MAVPAVRRNRAGRSAAMLPLKIGRPKVPGIEIVAPVTLSDWIRALF
jgi:hypothetical protein